MAAALLWTQPLAAQQDIVETSPILVAPAQTVAPTPIAAPAAPLNAHLVVTEEFLNQIVARQEVRPGEVRDQFEDTPVAGQQVTATQLRINLLPSTTEGRLLMVLHGDTSSNTAGFSSYAIVNSVGHQQFRAQKEVLFDGFQFATRHAAVAVSAESQNVGATTKFTGRPLGPLVEQIVLDFAQKRQPAAEAFARQRVVERVYPEFDGQIDAQLGNANQLLKETVQPRLVAAKLMPERVRVRTTDTHLHLAASIAVPREIDRLAPAPDQLVEPHAVSIYLHESMFQGLIARAPIAGFRTNSRELEKILKLISPSVELPETMSQLDVDIEFAKVDPLVVRIVDDETRVTLRASFHAAGQEVLPPFEVTLPYRLKVKNDQWVLSAKGIGVRSLNGDSNGSSIAEIAVKKIIEASLPELHFPRRLPANLWPEGKVPPTMTSVRSGNGWLVIGID